MKSTLRIALAIVISTLLVASCDKLSGALSGIPGKYQGQCLDQNGAPRGYISVVLKDVKTGEEKYTQNAEDSGNFFFDAVDPGEYEVLTYMVGKSPLPNSAGKVKITPGKTLMKNITVLPQEQPQEGGS